MKKWFLTFIPTKIIYYIWKYNYLTIKKAVQILLLERLLLKNGSYLLSHLHAVPSAQPGLTSL
ncbi:MAG: hypothetical protein LBU22_06850, partial [Dysgonamonadaceae bacterium]|nr:hypothetical protein [Dysgonamonadaceae bacterium]